jgi:hypothetical protein
MHAFSILTLGIFVAGYSTARWDLVTRLHELALFAWDYGVVTRVAKGVGLLSVVFFLLALPVAHLAAQETELVSGAFGKVYGERLIVTAPTNRRQRYLCARAAQAARVLLVG